MPATRPRRQSRARLQIRGGQGQRRISGPQQDWIDPNIDNRAALDTLTIYRTLRWGKTLEIILTDNRSYKSPSPQPPKIEGQSLPAIETVKLLDLGRSANDGDPPATIPDTDIAEPAPRRRRAARCSGPTQKEWFKDVLKASRRALEDLGERVPGAAPSASTSATSGSRACRTRFSASTAGTAIRPSARS